MQTPSQSENHLCTGETEEEPGEEPQMTISPPGATSKCIPHIPESLELPPSDRPQLETNEPSTATGAGASECNPGERTAPGLPANKQLLPYLRWRRKEEKEPIPGIPEPDNPRVHREDLLGGVYEHSEILSPAGQLKD